MKKKLISVFIGLIFCGNAIAACENGQYMDSTSSSCKSCPTFVVGTTSVPGMSDGATATSMADCYLPADISYTDEKGTFHYTEKCEYK